MAKIIAFCAKCKKEFPSYEGKANQGVRFICPNDNEDDPKHLASFVKDKQGKFWLRIELWILNYELHNSPIRWFKNWGGFFGQRAGFYLFFRMLFPCILLYLMTIPCNFYSNDYIGNIRKILILLFMFYILIDIILANTSVVFIFKFPANILRSVFFLLINFISIALCFSVIYFLFFNKFKPNLTAINAVYFSFVTITTIGYGDFKPLQNAYCIQLMIILEIIIGIYFLAVVVAIVSSWANAPLTVPTIKKLDEMFPIGYHKRLKV
jgi:hypothetical protein